MNSKARRAAVATVQFPKHYGKTPSQLKPITRIGVAGFDIEADAATADPYVICAATDQGQKFRKSINSADDAFSFLALPCFSRTINGFWNIGYDSEGMLRFLPDSVKYLLSQNPEVFLDYNFSPTTKEKYQFKLRLIPKKSLTISHVLGTRNTFFDFAQFFGMQSLQNVATRLLGVGKLDEDASQSDRSRYLNDPAYRRRMEDYCLHDAHLTARIGSHLVRTIHRFLPTRNFTSRASIAEQYLTRNGYRVPQTMRQFYPPFLSSFWGGRFELLKRGFIPQTHTSDLKSAYPWAMRDMPILTENAVKILTHTEYDKSALYGAYHISISIPHSDYLGPVPVESKGPIVYPCGSFTTWIDKETLLYLTRNKYQFSILEGHEIHDENAAPALQKPIDTLFHIKENPSEDQGIRDTAKIIMNGGYGKTIQLLDDTEGFLVDLDTAISQNLPVETVTPDGIFATRHTGIFRSGAMFCPPYASYITGKTRVRIMEAAQSLGMSNVAAIQTDSITSINKKLPSASGLGAWEYKGQYDLAIGKSGFYQFQQSGESSMSPLWKIFNRPAETKARSYGRITDISQPAYRLKRRTSLRQCAQKHDFTDLNLIAYRTIQNNINTDSKRVWLSPITFDDLRPGGRTVDSAPLIATDSII